MANGNQQQQQQTQGGSPQPSPDKITYDFSNVPGYQAHPEIMSGEDALKYAQEQARAATPAVEQVPLIGPGVVPGPELHGSDAEVQAMQQREAEIAAKNEAKEKLFQENEAAFRKEYPFEWAYRKGYGAVKEAITEPILRQVSPETRKKIEPTVGAVAETALGVVAPPPEALGETFMYAQPVPMPFPREALEALPGYRRVSPHAPLPEGKYYYHATPKERLESIRTEGLRKGAWLANSPDEALRSGVAPPSGRREDLRVIAIPRDKIVPGEPIPEDIGAREVEKGRFTQSQHPIPVEHLVETDHQGRPLTAPPEPTAPAHKGNPEVTASAQRYNAAIGQDPIDHTPLELPSKADRDELADAYANAEHKPNNPEVQHAYQAMKDETKAQYDHLTKDLGIKVDFTPEDPYKSADEMMQDVRENKHLSVFTGGEPPADHPLSEVEPETGQTYNHLFRATHDVYGHSAAGNDFSEAGEHAAYGAHTQMYSTDARSAVRTETQGQANWFFNNEGVRAGKSLGAFPEQKATILPEKSNVFEDAAQQYGLTDNVNKAGYIGPDGRMLDFSEGQAVRVLDHGDIAGIKGVDRENPRNSFVAQTGAMRVLNGRKFTDIHFDINHPPTAEQLDRITPLIEGGKNVNVDISVGDRTIPVGGAAGDVNNVDDLARLIVDARKNANQRMNRLGYQPPSIVHAAAMNIPQKLIGKKGDTLSTLIHEFSHAIVGKRLFGKDFIGGVISHLHPSEASVGSAAGTEMDMSIIPGAVSDIETGDTYFPKENLKNIATDLAAMFFSGGVGEEISHGIPIHENPGLIGDEEFFNSMTNILGLSLSERQELKAAGIMKARKILTAPGTLDIMKRYAENREEGLSEQFHASPDYVNKMYDEITNGERHDIYKNTTSRTAAAKRAEATGRYGQAVYRKTVAAGKGRSEAGVARSSEESTQPKITLQKLVERYGTTTNPEDVYTGAFITPDGKYINLGGVTHDDAILEASKQEPGKEDPRISFIRDSGVIRLRISTERAGETAHISVPKTGVTPEQVDALKKIISGGMEGGRGNISMEVGEPGGKYAQEEFVTAARIEPMLRKIGAHPESIGEVEAPARRQHWSEIAASQKDGFTIDPRTGEIPTKGYPIEIYPEARETLDHNATAKDIQDFYEDNRALFDAHPELVVGGYGKELNISAVAPTKAGAEAMGRRLDQQAVWDIEKAKAIETKGEGKRTTFNDYSLENRVGDLHRTMPQGFEHLTGDVYDNLEPDERAYLHGEPARQKKLLQHLASDHPDLHEEIKQAMQIGAPLGGWWQRYMDTFEALGKGEKPANAPSHPEALKAWHAALSGNKKIEDANHLAWGTYKDWLKMGRPTDRASLDKLIKKYGASPFDPESTGVAAISDTIRKGKVVHKGLDTTKLYNLVNSPEMRGERPFPGTILDPEHPSPLAGVTPGALKIPSMGATVAGQGNLRRLVIDTHVKDFFGQNGLTHLTYLADSVRLRKAAQELGLHPSEGQEQLWGTVLGIKNLLMEGMGTPEVATGLTGELISNIGKDYAEIIKNDSELSGIFEELKAYGLDPGSSRAQARLDEILAGRPEPKPQDVNQALVANTIERIKGQLPSEKLKQAAEARARMQAQPSLFEPSAEPPIGRMFTPPKIKKAAGVSALEFLKAFSPPKP